MWIGNIVLVDIEHLVYVCNHDILGHPLEGNVFSGQDEQGHTGIVPAPGVHLVDGGLNL